MEAWIGGSKWKGAASAFLCTRVLPRDFLVDKFERDLPSR
jgi:hypothetical protein